MRTDPMTFATLLYLLKATAVLLLTLGVALLLRRASAGTRHLAWLAAVAVVVAMPALGAALPDLRILPLPATATGTGAELALAPEAPTVTRREEGVAPAPAPPATDAAAGVTAEASGSAATADLAARLRGWLEGARWGRILFLVWLTGTLLVLGRLAHSAFTLRRILREAEPLSSQDWATPLYEAADRLELAEAPRLLRSDRVAMPFACGLLRPTIVVPSSAEEWPAARRRAVLFHELAHIRRKDLFGHSLGRIACALYWMHPLVWAAAYRLRAESERACDDLVLSTGTPASEYADHLLQILVGVRAHDAPAVALPMGRRREFEGRLLAILDPALRRRRPTVGHALVLVAFSLAAAGLVALAPMDASGSAIADAGAEAEAAESWSAAQADDRSGVVARGAAAGSPSALPQPPARGVPLPPSPEPFPAPDAQANPTRPHFDRLVEDFATHVGEGMADAVGDFVGSGLQIVFGGGAAGEKDIPLLVRLLSTDPDAEVRRTAAWGLYGTGDERAIAALVRALDADADAEVREMAAWALHTESGPSVWTGLGAATRDADASVRGTAVWSLAHSGSPGAPLISTIAARLGDPDPEVRVRAAWAIGRLNPASAPAPLYQSALSDAEAEVRVASAWALGQVADPAARPALARALRTEQNPEALRAFVYALHQLGPLESAEVEALLASEDAEVRTQAIRILAGAAADLQPWPWPWPEPRPLP